jgi:hypothetical protein
MQQYQDNADNLGILSDRIENLTKVLKEIVARTPDKKLPEAMQGRFKTIVEYVCCYRPSVVRLLISH